MSLVISPFDNKIQFRWALLHTQFFIHAFVDIAFKGRIHFSMTLEMKRLNVNTVKTEYMDFKPFDLLH